MKSSRVMKREQARKEAKENKKAHSGQRYFEKLGWVNVVQPIRKYVDRRIERHQ